MRELVDISKALQSFSRFVAGTAVHLHTDSQAAWSILSKGCSAKSALHRLAVEVFWWCVSHDVRLHVTWIPRTLNEYADHLAGIYDSDDWMLSEYWFQWLDSLWGKHTIDRFATDKNHLLPRFMSGALASHFWSGLQVSPRDPLELALLKSMKEGMVATRAPSTWMDSYTGIIRRFRSFCADRVPPRVPVPATPITVCLFLQLVAFEAKSYAVVKSASGALFSLHEMALVPVGEIPTKHPLAKGIRAAAKRRIGLKLVNQKDPLELDVLQSGILLYVPDVATCPLVFLC
ncbi:hypothetical protein CYMTET_16369 [Cymbomonas tetramitiformis]|uniref:RNase H type-1 domain-containing protein n=1 Tax=Cymbomonas tetramitiformis TaxID=36881 RepID=A0AAE0L802_9CHLO|nr:hypothetical protein CYMTET_16369 [Cymbomonas tetramitiformis]